MNDRMSLREEDRLAMIKMYANSKLLFRFAAGPSFSVAPSAPDSHRYKLSLFQPRDPKAFIKFVRKEINLLRTALPKGISVKAYEDRMVSIALLTDMIRHVSPI